VDRLIDAVGEEDLLWPEAEMRGEAGLDGFAFGIAGEVAARDSAKTFKDARRAGKGVLVKVEPEAGAVAERRVILLHAADGRGGLRTLHFDVSHEHLARGSPARGR
jgi:hypothetical protein